MDAQTSPSPKATMSPGNGSADKRRKPRRSAVHAPNTPSKLSISTLPNGDVDMEVEANGNAEASSSKLPSLPSAIAASDENHPSAEGKYKKRKDKARQKKEKRIQEAAAAGAAAGAGNVNMAPPPAPQKSDMSGQTSTSHRSKTSNHNRKERKKHRIRMQESVDKVWRCYPLAQGAVGRIPPVWSQDGRFYMTVEDRSVHIHLSESPSKRLSTLSSSQAITALVLSPVDASHIVTSSEDGKIIIWDYVKGVAVQTIEANDAGPVGHMCLAPVGGEWTIFATISVKKGGKDQYQQRVVRIAYPTTFTRPERHVIGRLSLPATAIFVSPSSQYLIALAGNKAYTYLLPSAFAPSPSASESAAIQCVKFVSDQPLTCGAFAPLTSMGKATGPKKPEDWFATGDTRGVIRLWHGLGAAFKLVNQNEKAIAVSTQGEGTERRLPTTSLHWHAHAVAAIAFTPGGSQLLSVGEESVLVQWHLASGKREYIPRLGGQPLVSLAVKEGKRGQEEEWWVKLQDGGVMKIGAASGHVQQVGHNIRFDPLQNPNSSALAYPLTIHPSTSSLVLPSSHPSTIQFIDSSSPSGAASVLFDLEVVPSNRISKRDSNPLESVGVENIAFSANINGRSEWMATVEGREGRQDEGEGSGKLRVLKIWRWMLLDDKDGQGERGRYIVNTTYPRPHGLDRIKSLEFSEIGKEGERPMLLSASEQGGVKTWAIKQSRKSEHGKTAKNRAPVYEVFWVQRSAFSYRSLPIHAARFSPDGTILALAHGPIISLWDVESNTLLQALDSHVEAVATGATENGAETAATKEQNLGEIKEILFVGDEGRWLVGAGAGLIVWDLFACEAIWSIPTPHAHLTSHPSGFTALSTVSTFTILSLFAPQSSKPILDHKIEAQSFRSVIRLPSSSSSSSSSSSATSVRHASSSTPSTVNPDSLSFVALTSASDLVKFGFASAPLPHLSASLVNQTKQNTVQRGIWQEMFGDAAFALDADFVAAAAAEAQDRAQKSGAGAGERRITGRASAVFDGPSHTLPPVSTLFDAFIDEVLAVPVVAGQGQVDGAAANAGATRSGEMDMNLDEDDSEADISTPTTGTAELASTARTIGSKEISDLESFFRHILTMPPGSDVNESMAESTSTDVRVIAKDKKEKKRLDGKEKKQRKRENMDKGRMVSMPTKTSSGAEHNAVQGDGHEDQGRDIPHDGGERKKKRKAPRDSVA